MLVVPANSRGTFTIVGLDPGTHNLGLGALHVDMNTYKIQSFECYTLVALKLLDNDSLLIPNHGPAFARVTALRECITAHLRRLRPSVVACEDAYFNRRTPGAYSPLLMSINSIREAVLDYNPFLPFTLIEPSVIKAAVGAQGSGNNKERVLEGIRRIKEFDVPTPTPLALQTDHAIDSVAIAYARLKQIR